MDIQKLKKGNDLQSEIKELKRILDCSTGEKKGHYIVITCKVKTETSSSEFYLPDDVNEKARLFIAKTISDRLCELQDAFNAL